MKNFFKGIVVSYKNHDCFNLAANISFYAILSIIPLTMIMFSVLGYFLGSEEVFRQIIKTLTGAIPRGSEAIIANIEGVVNSRYELGWMGIGFMVFIALLLFSSLEHALDRIFESVKKRNFFHSKLLAVIVIFIIALFLYAPSAITLLEGFLHKYGFSVPLSKYISGKTFFFVFAALSFAITVVIVPNRKILFRYAILGGAFYAFAIGVARYLFRWYMAFSFDRYNLIYGSLTALVLLVIWIYYLANILLLSSEIVAYLQKKNDV